MKNHLVISLSFFFFFQIVFGQKNSGLGIETNFQFGKIIKHTKNFQPPIPSLTSGIEINFIRQTNEKKNWHQLHNYPQTGYSFSFTHFGDAQILGYAIGFAPNIFFPLTGKDKFSFGIRLACGIAFINKRYNVIDNPTNNVIGTRMNNTSSFGIHLNWKATKKLHFLSSVSLAHFSNGNFQSPNLGINFASLNLGIKFFPNPIENFTRQDSLPPFLKKIKFNLKIGCGLNEESITNGPKYPIYIASLYVDKLTGLKNKIGLGVDVEYNKSVYDFEILTENFIGKEKWYAMRIAPFITDELLVGQIGMLGQIGVYAHKGFLNIAPFYFKIALKHYVFNLTKNKVNWYYGIFLKVHYARAEFFELATGISF